MQLTNLSTVNETAHKLELAILLATKIKDAENVPEIYLSGCEFNLRLTENECLDILYDRIALLKRQLEELGVVI